MTTKSIPTNAGHGCDAAMVGTTTDPLQSHATPDMSVDQLTELEAELLLRIRLLRSTLNIVSTNTSALHARSIAAEALAEDVELAEETAMRVTAERAAADPAAELRRCEQLRKRVLAGEWRGRRTA